jgi:hypothetical protein
VDKANNNTPYARPEEFGRPTPPSDLSIYQWARLVCIVVFIYVYVNYWITEDSESGCAHEVIDLPINYVDRHIVTDFGDLVCGIERCLIVLVICVVSLERFSTKALILEYAALEFDNDDYGFDDIDIPHKCAIRGHPNHSMVHAY